MSEGGEQKLGTNINAMLEQIGISVNNDSVIRKTFYKYLHPKEAYIGNGVLNNELVRQAFQKIIEFKFLIIEWRMENLKKMIQKDKENMQKDIRTQRMSQLTRMKMEV